MLLGDMGADVVKIEKPDGGDDTRALPPYLEGESCYFLSVNRNKRSVVLDLKTHNGQEAARRLISAADVVVEGFREGAMDTLGLGYEAFASSSPGLIYCKISGYGRTGPKRHRRSMDLTMQAEGGLMSVTGEPGRPPVRAGFAVVDTIAGLYAAWGVLNALVARTTTGRGQLVDTSLFETQVASQLFHLTGYLATGKVPQPQGSGQTFVVPYQAFKTKDDYVIIAVGNDRLWGRMCEALGLDHLRNDARFRTNPDRVAHKQQLVELLETYTITQPTEYWLSQLEKANVPAARVNTIDRVLSDPQTQAREMVVSVGHPRIPNLQLPGLPVKLSFTPGSIRRPPPMLGQHTEEVLHELEMPEDVIRSIVMSARGSVSQ